MHDNNLIIITYFDTSIPLMLIKITYVNNILNIDVSILIPLIKHNENYELDKAIGLLRIGRLESGLSNCNYRVPNSLLFK
jgi:hypothetical protein